MQRKFIFVPHSWFSWIYDICCSSAVCDLFEARTSCGQFLVDIGWISMQYFLAKNRFYHYEIPQFMFKNSHPHHHRKIPQNPSMHFFSWNWINGSNKIDDELAQLNQYWNSIKSDELFVIKCVHPRYAS